MHVQSPTPNWPDGLLSMPDYSMLLSVNDPGVLLDGMQKWTAAGRDPAKLYTAYRHYDLQLATGSWEEMRDKWRAMFFRFIDRTYLERYAPIVGMVLENNEYFDNNGVIENGLARYINSARAAVSVWNGEFRGRTVTSPDGGRGTIRADCRLVIGNCLVWHIIPREYYQLAVDEDTVLGYHNYSLWTNGRRYAADWDEHTGRWAMLEQVYGLKPLYAFTEGGPYNGSSAGGWRADNCMGGNVDLLVSGMRQVYTDMTQTPAYREGRLLGPGALFTIGGAQFGWPMYELGAGELVRLGRMLTEIWKPGVYSGDETMDAETKAAILVHARAIEALLEPPAPPTPVHDLRSLTNQQTINLFATAFGKLPTTAPPYIAAIGRALTTEQEQVLFANRAALYLGPAVEVMTLTPAEKAALLAALG